MMPSIGASMNAKADSRDDAGERYSPTRSLFGAEGRVLLSCVSMNVCSCTVTVAERDPDFVLAATVKATSVVPEPFGVTTVSHWASLTAVHAHPACVVTAKVPLPPSLGNVALPGDSA
jgi:hypothetical protein